MFQVRARVPAVDSGYIEHLNTFAVRSDQLICGDNCFRLPYNCRQDPKYDKHADILVSLIAALANGTGGVIFLTNYKGDNAYPSEEVKDSFRGSLLNFLRTALSHFKAPSVSLEYFDHRLLYL